MAPIMKAATSFIVSTEQEYLDADTIIATIRQKVKAREEEFLPGKELATKTWKWHVALWKKYIDDPLEACKTLDRKRYAWKKAEDAKRAAEAERLRREEQKKAEEEKLALAERLETAGMKEQAEKVLDAPVAPTTVAAPVKVEKVQGQSMIENWQGRIVDPDLVPRELCSPDPSKISKKAKLMKSRASDPGIVYEDVGTTRRQG
jgi:coenzyme F420-reducing hydrogenase alpha subunit